MEQAAVKLRKGTKSCAECRRRKIRCNWERGEAQCRECQARGSECREQVRSRAVEPYSSENKSDLKKRVARLEQMIRSMKKLQTTDRDPADLSSEDSEYEYHDDAVPLTLFDNSVFAQSPESSAASHHDSPATNPSEASGANPISSKQSHKYARIRSKLTAILPPKATIEHILSISDPWWNSFAPLGPLRILPAVRALTLSQFVNWALLEEHPAVVGIAVYCIAMSISMLSPAQCEQLQLIGKPHQILDRYMHTIATVVLPQDLLMKSVEGLELHAAHMHYYMTGAQPRKAWMTLRQAISNAQLLGLHKKNRSKCIKTVTADPEGIWRSLFSTDRYLSLLLGLPYCIPTSLQPDLGAILDDSGIDKWTLHFHFSLAVLAGSVIDRNELSATSPSYAVTLEVDQKIKELHASMPADWWDFKAAFQAGNITAAEMQERIVAILFHHQLLAYLHLPFMLKSDADPRYEYCRIACLEASRNLLQHYHRVRSNISTGFSDIKIIDFVGFIAAVQLLLGIIGYGGATHPHDTSNPDQVNRAEADWRLILHTRDIFHKAHLEAHNSATVQALNGLDTLCAAHGDDWKGQVRVPYFGTINISFRRGAQTQQQKVLSYQQKLSARQGTTPESGPGTVTDVHASTYTPELSTRPSVLSDISPPDTTYYMAPNMTHASLDLSRDDQAYLPAVSSGLKMPFQESLAPSAMHSTALSMPEYQYQQFMAAQDFTEIHVDWDSLAMDLDLEQDWLPV